MDGWDGQADDGRGYKCNRIKDGNSGKDSAGLEE